MIEAIHHAGIKHRTRVEIDFIDAEDVEKQGVTILEKAHAILVPGGFGKRGFEGKIASANYARTSGTPYFGICYGLHAAIIDFARGVGGYSDANSTEIDSSTGTPVIGLITEWLGRDGNIEQRSNEDDLGGTMRLGEQACDLQPNTNSREMYGCSTVFERHRHRYEVNNTYVEEFVKKGLVVAGRSKDGQLVEMIELEDHPWFVACQFHPEFTSTPREGHPLFSGFIAAANQFAANTLVKSKDAKS